MFDCMAKPPCMFPLATVPVTLTGVSLGIQSICPREDALFLFPLCFTHSTHYALYKVFIGLCQTRAAFSAEEQS